MVTKGYNSYHGRMSGGKIVLIVVLALVLVGAVAYLALQNYVVYDEAGNATIDLPFFHRKDDRGEKTDDSTVDGTGDRDDIVDTGVPEHGRGRWQRCTARGCRTTACGGARTTS